MRLFSILLICLFALSIQAQDSVYLKVHFLYGSKPKKRYQDSEPKWFGGILGGHVGIEGDTNEVVNFLPQGVFHQYAKPERRHSRFEIHSAYSFYGIMGGSPDSVKKLVVYIPISQQQKMQFDSITRLYLAETPYDYALFGMRCGAATYDILGQIGVLPHLGYRETFTKVAYPKILRKQLLHLAKENHWLVVQADGTKRRKWEQD
jgi:hypothetical protein